MEKSPFSRENKIVERVIIAKAADILILALFSLGPRIILASFRRARPELLALDQVTSQSSCLGRTGEKACAADASPGPEEIRESTFGLCTLADLGTNWSL